jgi:large subunit ribosomal protein L30
MSQLKITLTRSPIGSKEQHKRTVRALGITKMQQTVVLPDNDAVRGMVKSIRHLLTVEPVADAKS